jgi:hypothetical protein
MTTGIVTFVHGWYVDYIPLYVFSVLRAYPEYFVKVFVNCSIPRHVKESLKFIPSDRFHIENIFVDREQDDPVKKPYYLRWLLEYKDVAEFDHVFVCDVDFLMLPEEIPMHKRRLNMCNELPFSNFIRSPHPDYPSRITGWHFFVTDPYYEKVGPVVRRILEDPSFDISNPPSYCYDNGTGEKQWGQESLLYQIIKTAFNPDEDNLAEDSIGFANHHGLHMGPFRGKIPILIDQNNNDAIRHMGKNLKYWMMYQEIFSLISDPIFCLLESKIEETKVKQVVKKTCSYFRSKLFI